MSFEINGPSNKPVIREAQTMENNGGGGNLGYMAGGKKKDENEQGKDLDQSIFDGEDEFIKSEEQELQDETEPEGFIDKIKKALIKKDKNKNSHGDFLTLTQEKKEEN